MTKTCGSCGKTMDDSAAFCPACGKPADDASFRGAHSEAGAGETRTTDLSNGPVRGLDAKLAGALCYLWIVAIVFLVIEPYNRDRFVRFHAFQALFLGIGALLVHAALALIPVLGWMLMPVWGLLVLVLGVVAALRAYQGQTWPIPVIGPLAQQQV